MPAPVPFVGRLSRRARSEPVLSIVVEEVVGSARNNFGGRPALEPGAAARIDSCPGASPEHTRARGQRRSAVRTYFPRRSQSKANNGRRAGDAHAAAAAESIRVGQIGPLQLESPAPRYAQVSAGSLSPAFNPLKSKQKKRVALVFEGLGRTP